MHYCGGVDVVAASGSKQRDKGLVCCSRKPHHCIGANPCAQVVAQCSQGWSVRPVGLQRLLASRLAFLLLMPSHMCLGGRSATCDIARRCSGNGCAVECGSAATAYIHARNRTCGTTDKHLLQGECDRFDFEMSWMCPRNCRSWVVELLERARPSDLMSNV